MSPSHEKRFHRPRWKGNGGAAAWRQGVAIALFVVGIAAVSTQAQSTDDAILVPTYGTAEHTLSKRDCKAFQSRIFCMRCTLSYPDAEDADAPDFFRFIPRQIKDLLQKYRKCDPDEIVGEMTENDLPDVDFYREWEVDVSDVTPSTYTLAIRNAEFSGGAHGSEEFEFRNYRRKDGRPILMRDLFKKRALRRFRKIAARIYRQAYGLSPTDDLSDKAGWFENRFVLPENFDITTKGLYFAYNVYEVTPRAVEPPSFLVPYPAFRKLIDPKGPIAFALDPDHPVSETNNALISLLRLDLHKEKKGVLSVDLTFRILDNVLQTLSYYKSSRITVQFPSLRKTDVILDYEASDDEDNVTIIPAGKPIDHFKRKKTVRSRWLQVILQTTDDQDPLHGIHYLHLRLRLPKKCPFLLYYRLERTNDKGKVERAPLVESYNEGQQGLSNYTIKWGK